MALAASTITQIERRWGSVFIAQHTQRENYKNNQTTDADVLETAVLNAIEWVQQRKGPVTESSRSVIEAVPIFLDSIDNRSAHIDAWNLLYDELRMPTAKTATNAVASTDSTFDGVYSGDDFIDDQDLGRGSRAARGTQQ